MGVNRNLWSADEVKQLFEIVNVGFNKGLRLYTACKEASTVLHRSAESCMLKYRYETDQEFRNRGKIDVSDRGGDTSSITIPSLNTPKYQEGTKVMKIPLSNSDIVINNGFIVVATKEPVNIEVV